MTKKPATPFPESTPLDVTNTALQAGFGSIPIIGGAAAPLIGALVSAPLEKRRAAWFNRIGEGLLELEARFEGFDPSSLSENEDFVSAVYETTHAAMRSSHEGKRQRLANVVLNIAAGRSVSDALTGRFTSLVQVYSEEHILLLRLCDHPLSFPRVAAMQERISMGGRLHVFEEELRHHGVSTALVNVVAKELEGDGLIQGGLNVTMTASGLFQSSTTDLGKAFLQFISSPLQDGP